MNLEDIKCEEIKSLIKDKYVELIGKANLKIIHQDVVELGVPSEGLIYEFSYVEEIRTVGVTYKTIKGITICDRGYNISKKHEIKWETIWI